MTDLNQVKAAVVALKNGVSVRSVHRQLNDFGIYFYKAVTKNSVMFYFSLDPEEHKKDSNVYSVTANIGRDLTKHILQNKNYILQ